MLCLFTRETKKERKDPLPRKKLSGGSENEKRGRGGTI